MKEPDFSSLNPSALQSHEALCAAFKKYLCDVLDYFDDEADFVIAEDFADPYTTPYVLQDYIGVYEIGGVDYEVRKCHTDFKYCGIFYYDDKPPFEFYMLFDETTLPDNTVGSYMDARKMYIF